MTWQWRFFTPDEMRCKCGCGQENMADGFMNLLDRVRRTYNRPIIINSAYRCPDYNNQISTTGRDGPHTTGRAVDAKISSPHVFDLALVAMGLGMKGLGFKQHGPHEARFLHMDDLSKRVWTYP
jgi:uncharacterized protein YcbK (DUF882 family)